MVVHYHEAICHAKKMAHYLQYLDHSKGYNQNVSMSTISSKLLIRLQLNFVWGVLWKNRITVFKVKVTVKVQTVSKCLSG